MMQYPMIHVCYRVMNLQASEEFYRQAFGFEISRKKDFPESGFTLSYMTAPGLPFEIELTYNYGQVEPYTHGSGYSHLAVGVVDLEGSHLQHSKMGFEPTPLKGLSAGEARFYFMTDPDGYKIEIVRQSS